MDYFAPDPMSILATIPAKVGNDFDNASSISSFGERKPPNRWKSGCCGMIVSLAFDSCDCGRPRELTDDVFYQGTGSDISSKSSEASNRYGEEQDPLERMLQDDREMPTGAT